MRPKSGLLLPLVACGLFVATADTALSADDGKLMEATAAGQHDVLKKLARSRAAINAPNIAGVRPLHVAVGNGDLAATEILLDAGADPNATTWSGETPLLKAAWIGSTPLIRLLIQRGAVVDMREPSDHQTPLMWAVAKDHVEAAKALLEAGADVKARSKPNGFTPILFAARMGNVEMAKMLLAAGATVNDKVEVAAKTPAMSAANAPSRENAKPGPALTPAAWPQIVADPGAAKGPCGCAKGGNGWTPLLLATLNGHVELAKFFLEKGADPNADAPGFTALHYASGDWITQVTTPTVGVNYKGSRHWSALAGIPDQVKKIELIQALLDHGANVNATMKSEPAVLGIAVRPDVGITLWNATPFLIAAFSTNLDVMKLLVARGANKHAMIGETPQEVREAKGQAARYKKREFTGTTALMLAAGVGRVIGETAATEESSLTAVKWLTEQGAAVNAKNQYGETAIFGAAHARLNSVVTFLVDAGAELALKDSKGGGIVDAAEVVDQYGGEGRADLRECNPTGDLVRSLLARNPAKAVSGKSSLSPARRR